MAPVSSTGTATSPGRSAVAHPGGEVTTIGEMSADEVGAIQAELSK